MALYLEQDEGGRAILNALYEAKRQRPELDVRVLVDWHALSVAVLALLLQIQMQTGIAARRRKILALMSLFTGCQ
ncbi:phosphatidylserine synthase [Enterobacter cloacae]|uniref:Phosphatidylserine synthase n=1 Tax=Enterobacter cloacae TaxID=550 RepID=A0A377LU21_ENTCL|nr:phosphatidylserine synthase [Enterobacter cloacae]